MLKKKHNIDILFALLLYGLFVLLALLLVLIGAQIYKHIVDEADVRSSTSVTLHYVANKIRSSDSVDGLSLEMREGYDVLALRNEGSILEVLIYCYEGMLCEALRIEGEPLCPEDGEKLVPAETFSLTEENGMFTISTTDSEGVSHFMYVARRT